MNRLLLSVVVGLVAAGAALGALAFTACSGPIDPTPPDPHLIDGDFTLLFQDAGHDASGDAP